MNESGEPNMGNPSVRFDEGRERGGHWPLAFQSHPLLPTLHNEDLTPRQYMRAEDEGRQSHSAFSIWEAR